MWVLISSHKRYLKSEIPSRIWHLIPNPMYNTVMNVSSHLDFGVAPVIWAPILKQALSVECRVESESNLESML